MLDIKFIKANRQLIKEATQKKRLSFDVDKLLKLEEQRLISLAETEELRAKQNKLSSLIGQTQDSTERQELINSSQDLKTNLQTKEEELKNIMIKWRALMLKVPNIPDISVPDGDSDDDNKEISSWGEKKTFDFEGKSHIEILENLGWADFERGAKVSGFRGYFLKSGGAMLEAALWQFAWDFMIKKGFVPVIAPSLVRKEPFLGTGYLPQGEDDLYKTQDEEYLAGTSEVGMMGYFMNEVLSNEDLPKKFVAFSPCFRREAGSHGKDTKGLIRVHEFYKVEQIVLCEDSHQESVKWHEELRENAEEIMQALGIPYRVVINCGGDLGIGQVKKYDIEAWVPSENKYRETHSISYFHDWQTRRLNIKYKRPDGRVAFVHSLNGTALAFPRALVSLVENFQTADGKVRVPEVLKPYLKRQ